MNPNSEFFVEKMNFHKGKNSKYYTGTVYFIGLEFHVTYDIITGHLIIHEWYNMSREQYYELYDGLLGYFEEKNV